MLYCSLSILNSLLAIEGNTSVHGDLRFSRAESTTVHSYYHDLESLFYVLIWVCTMYSGPRGALRDKTFDYKKSVLSVWNGEMIGMGGHFPIVAWSKRAIMMHPRDSTTIS